MYVKYTYVRQIYLCTSNILMYVKYTYVRQIYLCTSNILMYVKYIYGTSKIFKST